ncbi:Uracil-DNA glycosylase [Alteromonadaceae bacterium Bs31]|nr:Uracil-DNA glycosylase [Alteromonadaceae bacterium Bs31]
MNETDSRIKLAPSWLEQVGAEFDKPYMQALKQYLLVEKNAGKILYPEGDLIFNALNSTPFSKVKVVVLGQDPYHGPGQAHGLCFSVLPGVPFPPSLKNIFKEINQDVGLPLPGSGCLQAWAERGVLLLNATLTVENARAGSHQGKGWETFTDAIIHALNQKCENLVFLLWGSYAQKKGQFIDVKRHCVLKAPHPSPLSAHRGFFGCHHFSKTNHYLKEHAIEPIDWSL